MPCRNVNAPFLDVEDGLHHASLPQFRLRASCQTLLPLVSNVLDLAIPKPALPKKVHHRGGSDPVARAVCLDEGLEVQGHCELPTSSAGSD